MFAFRSHRHRRVKIDTDTLMLIAYEKVAETMEVVSRNIAAADDGWPDGCELGCEGGSGQFCGTDGQCHFYSCKSWYEFGPSLWSTGFDNTSQLVCQDIPITQPYWDAFYESVNTYESVRFRCWSLKKPSPIQMGFTNKCTVSTSNSNFECYGLAADTNFQPFLDEVAASQLNCTDDDQNDLDQTGYPKYTYSVRTAAYHRNGTYEEGRETIQWGYNSTSEFNATLALTGTMSARYETWTAEPTGAPTVAPTASPTWTMNSAPFENESGMMAAARLLGVLYTFYLFL